MWQPDWTWKLQINNTSYKVISAAASESFYTVSPPKKNVQGLTSCNLATT